MNTASEENPHNVRIPCTSKTVNRNVFWSLVLCTFYGLADNVRIMRENNKRRSDNPFSGAITLGFRTETANIRQSVNNF